MDVSIEELYPDICRNAAHKEDRVFGVEVKQRVGARGLSFLDELLLVCGGLTGHSQEHLPMSTQPAGTEEHRESDYYPRHLLLHSQAYRM